MNGHTLVVKQLIAAGAALDVQNNAGYGRCANCNGLTLCKMGTRLLGRSTAVVLAASNGHTLVAEQLIAAGAKFDVQNNEGYSPWADRDDLTLFHPASRLLGRSTALILAAMNGHTPVVEKLIAAGADLNVQNNEGYGP
jgi:hypothetical protein